MSTPEVPRPPTAPAAPQYILETGVMIFFGICFLFPGLCSLYVIVGMAIDKRGNLLSDPLVSVIFTPIWVICFGISAIGVAMIVLARRRPRRTQ